MAKDGWELLPLVADWEELLRQALRPTLKLPGESGATADLALQLAAPTVHPTVWNSSTTSGFKGRFCQLDLEANPLPSHQIGWLRRGGANTDVEQADWVACSLSTDPQGRELSRVKEYLGKAKQLRGMIIDTPRDPPAPQQEQLRSLVVEVQTTHLGSFYGSGCTGRLPPTPLHLRA